MIFSGFPFLLMNEENKDCNCLDVGTVHTCGKFGQINSTVCEDYDTGKKYKTHKWEEHECGCEYCPISKVCARCGDEK